MALKCPVDHDEEVVIALAQNCERFAINGSGVAIGLDIAFPRCFDQARDFSLVGVIRNLSLQLLHQPWTHDELGVGLRKVNMRCSVSDSGTPSVCGLGDHLFNKEAFGLSLRCEHTDSA
jgi:hypothetical protein